MKDRRSNFAFIGGTHGIGRAAATEMARTGSAILLVARDPVAGQQAADAMLAAGASEARFLSADLATIAGMQTAAEGIAAWKPTLDGIVHSAMSAFSKKTMTADGLELAFAIQYLARAVINRLCIDALAASGDGRIVHIAGAVPHRMAPPILNDLQFEHRKWGFFKSVLSTHMMGFEHLDEAARRWPDRPVRFYATAVGSTRTKAMQSPEMPLVMRLMGRFGTTAEKSARNAVRVLLDPQPPELRAGLFGKPDRFSVEPFAVPANEAARLWDITSDLAARHGVILP